jgi:hypothetical protein
MLYGWKLNIILKAELKACFKDNVLRQIHKVKYQFYVTLLTIKAKFYAIISRLIFK